MIQAIETRYKGYRFRSRLEARWAVFFDAVGLEWIYEPEGFDLGDTTGWYLPDFKVRYSASGNWQWIEVKPEAPTVDEYLKIADLHYKSQKEPRTESVILCGYPGRPRFPVAGKQAFEVAPGSYFALGIAASGPASDFNKEISTDRPIYQASVSCFAYVGGGKNLDVWPMYAPLYGQEEVRDGVGGFIDPEEIFGCEPRDIRKSARYAGIDFVHGIRVRQYEGAGVSYRHPNLLIAYNAARAARFEHGESGA